MNKFKLKDIFKNPKTRLRNLLLVLLPFVILIAVFAKISLSSVSKVSESTSGTVYKDSIDSMDYHLRSNATDLQEELFKELTDVVNDGTDKAKIALLVCENFVADYYTWTNKEATYDIGGMYYVYSPQRVTIYQQSRNTFYKYLTYYIDTYGSENLLEVKGFVEGDKTFVEQTPSTYEIDGKTYESYFVTLEWEYDNLDTFKDIATPSIDDNEIGFATVNYFTVIVNEDGRFEIVQAWGDF